jgi:His-Xaa-Ser system protein HxsD
MTAPLPRLPEHLVAIDPNAGTVSLRIDAALYPMTALYAAAYVFIDRCYVLLDQPDSGHYQVTLSSKGGEAAEATLTAYAGEFANELLSCSWRAKIAEENRATIEAVTAQALRGAMGAPSLDDLEKFDFTEGEAFDDPLGIAMSWEEKYGKAKHKAAADDPDGAPKEGG